MRLWWNVSVANTKTRSTRSSTVCVNASRRSWSWRVQCSNLTLFWQKKLMLRNREICGKPTTIAWKIAKEIYKSNLRAPLPTSTSLRRNITSRRQLSSRCLSKWRSTRQNLTNRIRKLSNCASTSLTWNPASQSTSQSRTTRLTKSWPSTSTTTQTARNSKLCSCVNLRESISSVLSESW